MQRNARVGNTNTGRAHAANCHPELVEGHGRRRAVGSSGPNALNLSARPATTAHPLRTDAAAKLASVGFYE